MVQEKNSTASSFTAKTNLALLYVRVSSKAQEDGFSLAAQEKLGHEYAQKKNLRIVKSWKVSESAWRSERTAFNLLVEYAKRHDEIRHIIFDVTDRMTRNDFDKLKIYTLIKEHGKTIHLARSNKVFDKNSGSEEEFMLDIEVAVAKKQSNDISRKTKMGMLEKAEQGLYPSVAPIGYKNNRLTHLIEVDEERAPFIRKAFGLMASGSYSLAAIAKLLNQEGFRGRKGYRIGKSGIEKILKNPIYYGAFRWQGRLRGGSHPPLISKDLFDKACAALHGNARPYTNRRGFAFNNLLTCGDCECKVLGEEKKKRFVYYHCTFSKGRHNGWGYVPEREIAGLFGPAVKAVTLDEEIVEWLLDALKESDKSSRRLSENRLNSLSSSSKTKGRVLPSAGNGSVPSRPPDPLRVSRYLSIFNDSDVDRKTTANLSAWKTHFHNFTERHFYVRRWYATQGSIFVHEGEVHKTTVQRDLDEGNRLGITGTPAFFINGRTLSGAQPLEAFTRLIEQELAGVAASGTGKE